MSKIKKQLTGLKGRHFSSDPVFSLSLPVLQEKCEQTHLSFKTWSQTFFSRFIESFRRTGSFLIHSLFSYVWD